jgi:hypothetical protein
VAISTQLQLYNRALQICRETPLVTLEDNVPARYDLDQVWANGGVDYCLETGQWEFAMRATQIDNDPSVTPPWGYAYGFSKPQDWLMTVATASDEFFRSPMTRFVDEAGYWWSDTTPLYIRYVSNSINYGGNMGLWPPSFGEYVAQYFASCVVGKISKSSEVVTLVLGDGNQKRGSLHAAKMEALNRCAMSGPTQFFAEGAWSRARNR